MLSARLETLSMTNKLVAMNGFFFAHVISCLKIYVLSQCQRLVLTSDNVALFVLFYLSTV